MVKIDNFNIKKLLRSIKRKKRTWFDDDFEDYKRQMGNDETFSIGKLYPILTDKHDQGGVMSGHYFHQDLYVARLIAFFQANPVKHVDIGSRTDGFVAHVASFHQHELLDIRDIKSNVKKIHFRKADLMELPKDMIDYCDCNIHTFHAIEHLDLEDIMTL